MGEEKIRTSVAEVHRVVAAALVRAGCDGANADSVAAVVAAAERDGCASHGVFRLAGYLAALRSGKVFAIASWDDKLAGITFKVTPLSFEVLRAQPGLRPAPYLASRGLKWIQHHARPGLSRAELEQYLRVSHRLVAQGLSRKARTALGLA